MSPVIDQSLVDTQAVPVQRSGRINSVRVQTMDDLSPEDLATWSRIQAAEFRWESPYFRPEFAQAVAKVCKNVEVAVLCDGCDPVGFLPYHRLEGDVALPVGRELSDFHGVVLERGYVWNATQLLHDCGLKAWNFHKLIADQPALQPHQYSTAPSPFIDVIHGFDAYRKQRRACGSRRIKRILRQERKLVCEIGPVRLEVVSDDSRIFEQLLEWKSQQYRSCGLFDLFSADWIRNLLETIRQHRHELFAGTLFALYAGDKVVAIEFGMQSAGVFHSWFPAYDRQLARYGPGNILLARILQESETLGIRRVHLGKAEEEYKMHFASGSVDVAEGAVDLRPVRSCIKRGWHHTREWLKKTPLRNTLRKPVRFLRRLRDHITLA